MRRPRFSLLSMVLFTLLCGSAVALWLHWPAWRVMVALPGDASDHEVSPDRKWIQVRNSTTQRYELLDSNGVFVQALPQISDLETAVFTEDSKFVQVLKIADAVRPDRRKESARYWDIAGHRWMESPPVITERYWNNVSNEWKEGAEKTNGVDLPGYQLLSPDGRWRIVRLDGDNLFIEEFVFELFAVSPEKAMKRWVVKPGDVPFFRFDGTPDLTDTLVAVFPKKCERIELPSLEVKLTFPHPEHFRMSNDSLSMAYFNAEAQALQVVDVRTGALRATFPNPGFANEIHFNFSQDGKELAVVRDNSSVSHVCTIASGAIRPLQARTSTTDDAIHFVGDARIEAWSSYGPSAQLSAWDRSSGRLLFQGQIWSVSRSGKLFRVIDDKGMLWTPSSRTQSQLPLFEKYSFLYDPARILAKRVLENGQEKTFILARHRPEAWWGVAWLAEFWSTVVFAGLFVWNLRRGRFSR